MASSSNFAIHKKVYRDHTSFCHELSNNVVCATSIASDQPAQTRSLIRAFASQSLEHSMIVKLLTEHHLEFLSLKGGCRGSSESAHMSKCHIVGNHMPRLICDRHADQNQKTEVDASHCYIKCDSTSNLVAVELPLTFV